MNHRLLSCFLVGVALFAGCSTASLKEAKPIRIRSGLGKEEVKYALISAVLPERKPALWPAGHELTDAALRAHYDEKWRRSDGASWTLEDVKADVVILKHQRGRHALVVEYTIGETHITPRIVSSENLNQTERTIHENVFDWLESLEDVVDDNMEHLQDRKKR